MNADDPYLYPGSLVLRNKLGIRDAERLEAAERRLVTQRSAENVPGGAFNLDHLRSIHRHLFQDIFDWAGEIRSVEISKGGHQFQFRRFIETGMADVHRRLETSDWLQGLSAERFCEAAGRIIGDVNYVHPFRDGNGRTQLHFLKQLADQAGHPLELGRLDPKRWIEASRRAHDEDYAGLTEEIARARR